MRTFSQPGVASHVGRRLPFLNQAEPLRKLSGGLSQVRAVERIAPQLCERRALQQRITQGRPVPAGPVPEAGLADVQRSHHRMGALEGKSALQQHPRALAAAAQLFKGQQVDVGAGAIQQSHRAAPGTGSEQLEPWGWHRLRSMGDMKSPGAIDQDDPARRFGDFQDGEDAHAPKGRAPARPPLFAGAR